MDEEGIFLVMMKYYECYAFTLNSTLTLAGFNTLLDSTTKIVLLFDFIYIVGKEVERAFPMFKCTIRPVIGHSTHFLVGDDNPKVEGQ